MMQEIHYISIMQGWFSTDPVVLVSSLIIMIIIGAIVIFIAGVLIFFLPAIIVTGVVWWLTGSEFLAGLAFLLVSLASIFKRK